MENHYDKALAEIQQSIKAGELSHAEFDAALALANVTLSKERNATLDSILSALRTIESNMDRIVNKK